MRRTQKRQPGKCQLESSEEIRQKVDLLALAVQWEVEPRAPLPSARSRDDLGTACLAHVHTDSPERSKKLQRPQYPRGERTVPFGYGARSAFPLRARPKARGRGHPASPALGEAPGRTCSGAARDPRGRFPDARRPPPGARGPAAEPTQVLAASACPLLVPQVHRLRRSEGATMHLPFELFPHGCKGSAVGGGQEEE